MLRVIFIIQIRGGAFLIDDIVAHVIRERHNFTFSLPTGFDHTHLAVPKLFSIIPPTDNLLGIVSRWGLLEVPWKLLVLLGDYFCPEALGKDKVPGVEERMATSQTVAIDY